MQQTILDARRTTNSHALGYGGWGGLVAGLLFLLQHVVVPGEYGAPWQYQEYLWLFLFLVSFSVLVLLLRAVFYRAVRVQNIILHVWVVVLVLFSVVLTLLQLQLGLNFSSLTAICIIVCILLSTKPGMYFWLMGFAFVVFCAGYFILKPRIFHIDIILTALFATGISALVGFFLERYRLANLALSEQLAEVNSELVEQSFRDALTGAYNRHFLSGCLAHEVSYAHRYNMPLCLIMIDIDFFKKINDTHGHLVGDVVLKHTVKCFQDSLRQSDIITRFGGEEFAIVLPSTLLSNGMLVAEKLRASLASYEIPELTWTLTASMGLVAVRPGENPDDLIQRADQALYRAKNAGRNRVEID